MYVLEDINRGTYLNLSISLFGRALFKNVHLKIVIITYITKETTTNNNPKAKTPYAINISSDNPLKYLTNPSVSIFIVPAKVSPLKKCLKII